MELSLRAGIKMGIPYWEAVLRIDPSSLMWLPRTSKYRLEEMTLSSNSSGTFERK
jgi:hypothetical protein